MTVAIEGQSIVCSVLWTAAVKYLVVPVGYLAKAVEQAD